MVPGVPVQFARWMFSRPVESLSRPDTQLPCVRQSFTGAAKRFTGALDCSFGAVNSFHGALEPFSGAVERSYGALERFSGAEKSFHGAEKSFWGAPKSFHGAEKPSDHAGKSFSGVVKDRGNSYLAENHAVEALSGAFCPVWSTPQTPYETHFLGFRLPPG